MLALIAFLSQVVAISLTGVMAPGPITAVTVLSGTRSRHAGAMVAIGHGIVEFPLMLLIMAGMGGVFKRPEVVIAIGIVGGAFLSFLGIQMLLALKKAGQENGMLNYSNKSPLVIGMLLTITNPYFLFWWATVGLNLSQQALSLGVYAFGVFAVAHWLCDLIWLEILSWSSNKGRKFLTPKNQRYIQTLCAIAMLGFGLQFIFKALYV